MRQAIFLALALWAAFYFIVEVLDFRLAAAIGFSATMLIAAVNSLTFLWLWYARTTPLALGMALSWAGQAAISAWWFATGMPGKGVWLDQDPLIFLFLSIYIVGGGIHIAVIQNSAGSTRTAAIWPLMAIVAIITGFYIGS
jgi:hypothetical protein